MSAGIKARELRQKVMIPARMRAGETYADVCIRNISSRGLMLQAATPPSPGTYIEILRATHIIVGRIVWTKDRRFGVHTSERLNISAIVNQSAAVGQRRPNEERRSGDRPRAAARTVDAAEQLAQSHRFSRAVQFGFLMMGVTIAAGLLATMAYDTLSQPFQKVAAHLR